MISAPGHPVRRSPAGPPRRARLCLRRGRESRAADRSFPPGGSDSSWAPWRLAARPRGRLRRGPGRRRRGDALLRVGAHARRQRSRWSPCPFAARPWSRSRWRRWSPARRCVSAALARVPEALWVDDLSLIQPALQLEGAPSDFADAIRATPYGVPRPYGSIGVLYLEGYRAALRLSGTTVLGVRLPSALAGAASLVTAALLGRALLPAGGGMLTALILAGLRWHLILSRWALQHDRPRPHRRPRHAAALLAARRRRSGSIALAAGAMAGVGAHVYLSAWPASAALALFALWPAGPGESGRARVDPLRGVRPGVRGVRRASLPLPRGARDAVLRAHRGPQRDPGDAAGAFLSPAPGRGGRRPRVPLVSLRPDAAPRHPRAFPARVALRRAGRDRARTGAPPSARAPLGAPPGARRGVPGRDRGGRAGGQPERIALRVPLDAGRRGRVGRGAVARGPCAGRTPAGRRHGRPRRRGRRRGALGPRRADHLELAPGNLSQLSRRGHAHRAGRGAVGAASAPSRSRPGSATPGLRVDAVRRYRLDPDLAAARPEPRASLQMRIVPAGTVAAATERIVERVEDSRGRAWAVVLARRAPAR